MIEIASSREHGPFDSEAYVTLCLVFEKLARHLVEVFRDASPMSSLTRWTRAPTTRRVFLLRRRPAAVFNGAPSAAERERLAGSGAAVGRPGEGVRPPFSLIGTKETAP